MGKKNCPAGNSWDDDRYFHGEERKMNHTGYGKSEEFHFNEDFINLNDNVIFFLSVQSSTLSKVLIDVDFNIHYKFYLRRLTKFDIWSTSFLSSATYSSQSFTSWCFSLVSTCNLCLTWESSF